MSQAILKNKAARFFMIPLLALALVASLADALRLKGYAQSQDDKKQEEKKDSKKEEVLPLKPDGKIEFTTDEGTWMSLDLSSDGQTIVFELLGDIYTLPFAGGEAKLIAGGMSFDSQPRFSPDGKRIAFLSDRNGSENVWLMDADGQNPKQLTKGSKTLYISPSWTPDGNYVVTSRSSGSGLGAYAIWMYHKDGGSGIELIKTTTTPGPPAPGSPPPNSSLGPVTSPDGRWIFFSRRAGAHQYNQTSGQSQIMRFDRETGETTRVTGAVGSGLRPALSPNGKLLVYATRFDTKTGLRVRDIETGDERWLIYPVTRDDQESRATRDTYPGYAFTPDGKEVVTTMNGKLFRIDVGSGKAINIPFTAKVSQDVGPRVYFESRVEEGPVRARLIRWPSQSPDGKRVVFSALSKLYVMDLADRKPRRLTESSLGEFSPIWSPDGKWIAYVTWDTDGGHIWKVPASGGGPQQLTRQPAYYSQLSWSPDGERIVAVSGARRERIEEEFAAGLELRWLQIGRAHV